MANGNEIMHVGQRKKPWKKESYIFAICTLLLGGLTVAAIFVTAVPNDTGKKPATSAQTSIRQIENTPIRPNPQNQNQQTNPNYSQQSGDAFATGAERQFQMMREHDEQTGGQHKEIIDSMQNQFRANQARYNQIQREHKESLERQARIKNMMPWNW